MSLIGIPTEIFENGASLTSDLFVIPVGNGTMGYGKADETRRIDRAAAEARVRTEEEKVSLVTMEENLVLKNTELNKENATLLHLKNSGDISGYNAAVSGYNLHVADYNEALEEYRACYAAYLADVEFVNYVATHLYDRPGLSEAVTAWEREAA
ncbi:hypothetical protein [Methanogenium cariaci]|uniref:hypothetical protein n=1 Tax=Methanogenium cariaci TaxID=2197 RepID=UPI0007806C12|nr:hypothetical protein [Methanogenium cariaci]